MSFYEQTFTCTNRIPSTIREHFERMSTKVKLCEEKAGKELKTLGKFLSDLHFIGSVYEKSLFKLCEEFQQQMKHFVHDEKLSQYFQLVINSLLRHADALQKQYEQVSAVKTNLAAIDKDFRITTEHIIEAIGSSLFVYREKSQEFDQQYKKYIKLSLGAQQAGHGRSGRALPGPEPGPASLAAEAEEQALVGFADLKHLSHYNLVNLRKRISDCHAKELAVKFRLKQCALGLIGTFGTPLNADYEAKIESLEKQGDAFRCFFENLEKENSLDFNARINFSGFELTFCGFGQFAKLDQVFEQPYARTLSNKVAALAKGVSPRIRVYIELLIESLFESGEEFGREVVEEINYVMNNAKTSEFLVYLLILKKAQRFLDKPFANITLAKEQFRNLQPIAQYFFLNYINSGEANCEAVFNFLKFALAVFNEQKISFIESLAKVVILNDQRFWAEMLGFIGQHYKSSGNAEQFAGGNSGGNANLLTGLKNIVGALKTNLNAEKMKESGSSRAFDDVAFFLFKLRLDFETITDILLALAPRAGVPFEQVRTLLLRNQDLFLAQIAGQHGSTEEQERSLAKLIRPLTRPEKIALVCKKTVQFLNSSSELLSLILLSKFLYGERKRLLMRALLNWDLSARPALRRTALRARTDPALSRGYLTLSHPQEVDSIISLDVKRTFCEDAAFNAASLELILKNVSHPEVGRFSYYQGLNYIASYFFVVFGGDELATYNFIISLMHNSFFNYVDSDLKNLRKLFFCLKRLLKAHLPVLYNYLEHEQKLDMDIIFASWCLTLFTTITQYFPRSRLLDQIVDVFVAKGWPGFFRCVLVVLESLEQRLLGLGYEEILVLLSELQRNDFKEVVEADRLRWQKEEEGRRLEDYEFDFKKKIRKYGRIGKTLVICYHNEFYRMLEQIDEFWHKINKKIRLSS